MRQNYAICLAILSVFLLSNCSPTFEEQFPDAYKEYMKLPPNKALAIALDNNGGYAYGSSQGYETIQEAKKRALLECKARQTVYKLKTKCEIYMVNDKKVEEE